MKNLIQTILILFIMLLCSSTTEAFDGNRKGFVLSGGVGWTKYQNSEKSFNHLNSSTTFGFIIGYGLNDKNLLVIDRSISFHKHDGMGFVMDQAAGISWFHYYSKQKKSFFTKIGFGYYPDAIYFGGGYMFSNHMQVGLTYSYLTKSAGRDSFQLLLSYVAF